MVDLNTRLGLGSASVNLQRKLILWVWATFIEEIFLQYYVLLTKKTADLGVTGKGLPGGLRGSESLIKFGGVSGGTENV